jgi:hypothetical protein
MGSSPIDLEHHEAHVMPETTLPDGLTRATLFFGCPNKMELAAMIGRLGPEAIDLPPLSADRDESDGLLKHSANVARFQLSLRTAANVNRGSTRRALEEDNKRCQCSHRIGPTRHGQIAVSTFETNHNRALAHFRFACGLQALGSRIYRHYMLRDPPSTREKTVFLNSNTDCWALSAKDDLSVHRRME